MKQNAKSNTLNPHYFVILLRIYFPRSKLHIPSAPPDVAREQREALTRGLSYNMAFNKVTSPACCIN